MNLDDEPSLKSIPDETLIWFLENSEIVEAHKIARICAEVLRRMNERRAILPNYDELK